MSKMTEQKALELINVVLAGGGSSDERTRVLEAVTCVLDARGIDRRNVKAEIPRILADDVLRPAFMREIGEAIRRQLIAGARSKS